jgi:hypothetical protein
MEYNDLISHTRESRGPFESWACYLELQVIEGKSKNSTTTKLAIFEDFRKYLNSQLS